jgi:hypothetical protein
MGHQRMVSKQHWSGPSQALCSSALPQKLLCPLPAELPPRAAVSHTSIAEARPLPRKQVTNILLHALDGRSAAHNEADQKKNQKDNEQNPCNLGRSTGDAAESQNPGNQSDDKKSNAPT